MSGGFRASGASAFAWVRGARWRVEENEMKSKDIIRLTMIGVATFVVAWLVYGFVISTAVVLASTHFVDLSNAESFLALPPFLSIFLAVVTAVGVMVHFRRRTEGLAQPRPACNRR